MVETRSAGERWDSKPKKKQDRPAVRGSGRTRNQTIGSKSRGKKRNGEVKQVVPSDVAGREMRPTTRDEARTVGDYSASCAA